MPGVIWFLPVCMFLTCRVPKPQQQVFFYGGLSYRGLDATSHGVEACKQAEVEEGGAQAVPEEQLIQIKSLSPFLYHKLYAHILVWRASVGFELDKDLVLIFLHRNAFLPMYFCTEVMLTLNLWQTFHFNECFISGKIDNQPILEFYFVPFGSDRVKACHQPTPWSWMVLTGVEQEWFCWVKVWGNANSSLRTYFYSLVHHEPLLMGKSCMEWVSIRARNVQLYISTH